MSDDPCTSGQMQTEGTLWPGALGGDYAAPRARVSVPTVGVAPLAARPVAEDLRQARAGQGDPLRPGPPAEAAALPRPWLPGGGQQRGGTGDEADRAGQEEFSLRRLRRRRQVGRYRLHPDPDRQAERCRPAGLADRRARPDRRPQDHPDRRAPSLALRCGRSVTAATGAAPDGISRTLFCDTRCPLNKLPQTVNKVRSCPDESCPC
jgi:hypothetical protein